MEEEINFLEIEQEEVVFKDKATQETIIIEENMVFVYPEEKDPTVPDYVKNLTEEDVNKLSIIDNAGSGEKFLSDDGTYKEVKGSGGTSDYLDLDNKPSINNVELNGNKSLEDLGIQPKGDYAGTNDIPKNVSELTNDAGFINNESDPTVPDFIKNIKEEDITNWNNKSDFDGSYNSLKDKPPIPTKVSELENDSNFINAIPDEYVTEEELNGKGYLTEHQDISHLASKTEIPTKTSQLENDSNFINEIPSEYVKEAQMNEAISNALGAIEIELGGI